jgi:hypothetical protein
MSELKLWEPQRIFSTAKPTGMSGFTDRELGIDVPRIRIIHSTSGGPNEIGRPGQFKLNAQLWDALPVVVLRGMHYRQLVEGEGKQARTVCASNDGKTPHAEVTQPRSETCPSCPYAQWKEGVGGKRVPPPCTDGIALLMLVLTPAPGSSLPFQPAWFLCGRSATQKARDLAKALNERSVQTIADYKITVTTEYKKPAGVAWWEPVFTLGEQTDDYRDLSHYVDQIEMCYTPPVFSGTVAATEVPAVPGDPDPWDVPV